jgi:hypothetical protein
MLNLLNNFRKIGRIEGAFIRGKFDVTHLVHFDDDERDINNYIAVFIQKNDNPGKIGLGNVTIIVYFNFLFFINFFFFFHYFRYKNS